MARQPIDVGAFVDDPSAESINAAFTKVNAMTLELFTELSLGGRAEIDLLSPSDTIRDAFIKTNTNASALYTEQSLPSVPVIDVGDAPDDTGAETIYAGFVKVNTVMTAVYGSLAAPVTADFYVATTGNDGNAGTIGSPFRTIGKGVSVLSPGKTCLIRGGTYVEAVALNVIPAGTSWTNKVRVAAYPGETVWMRPTSGNHVMAFAGTQKYIEIDGLNMDGAGILHDTLKINAITATNNAHHIRIQNAELKGTTPGKNSGGCIAASAQYVGAIGSNEFINLYVHSTRYGAPGGADGTTQKPHLFYISSPNNLIEYCTMEDAAGNAVQLFHQTTSGSVVNNTVRYNIMRHLTQQYPEGIRHRGVVVGGVQASGNKIYGNLMYDIQGTFVTAGIELYQGANHVAYNNTIYDVNMHGIRVDSGASNATVRNNIAYNCGIANFLNDGPSTVQSHNLFSANPLFVNAAAENFRLQAGSPGVNTGMTLGAPYNVAIDGTARPQGAGYDMGAYERS